MNEKQLGKKLQENRVKIRLTQQELAETANISISAVRNIENGRGSSLKTLLYYLDVLEIQLFPFDESAEISPLKKLQQIRKSKPSMRVRKRNV